MIAMIEREAALSTPERPGRIIMKMNNLSDPDDRRRALRRLARPACASI